MTNEIVTTDQSAIIESVVIGGDLSKLSPAQRVGYYKSVCESLGLNPLTKPFDYITLNGRLTLYPKRDATDQLRKNNGVSITRLERENMTGVYIVTAYAQDKMGRTDSSTGAVSIENLKGDALANALMKAETKAKRRVTLSICGLGMLDETEIETIPAARPVIVAETGEVIEAETKIEQPITETETQQKADPPKQTKLAPANAAPLVKAFIENGIAEAIPEAAAIINKLRLSGAPTPEKIRLGKTYRAWRDDKKEPDEAAELALKGETPK